MIHTIDFAAAACVFLALVGAAGFGYLAGFFVGRALGRVEMPGHAIRRGRARQAETQKATVVKLPQIEANDVYPFEPEYTELSPEEEEANEALRRDVHRLESSFFERLGL